jgi:hypothetical protein
MIQSIALAVVFVALAVLAFVASIRLGMLVGLRLDRALEARAAIATQTSEQIGAQEELAPVDLAHSPAPQQPIADDNHGREDYRGE